MNSLKFFPALFDTSKVRYRVLKVHVQKLRLIIHFIFIKKKNTSTLIKLWGYNK